MWLFYHVEGGCNGYNEGDTGHLINPLHLTHQPGFMRDISLQSVSYRAIMAVDSKKHVPLTGESWVVVTLPYTCYQWASVCPQLVPTHWLIQPGLTKCQIPKTLIKFLLPVNYWSNVYKRKKNNACSVSQKYDIFIWKFSGNMAEIVYSQKEKMMLRYNGFCYHFHFSNKDRMKITRVVKRRESVMPAVRRLGIWITLHSFQMGQGNISIMLVLRK